VKIYECASLGGSTFLIRHLGVWVTSRERALGLIKAFLL